MKIPTSLFILTLLFLLVPALAHPVAAATDQQVFLPFAMNGQAAETNPVPTTLADIQAETIRLINIERVNAGCPAAIENETLNSAAQAWSDYLQTNNIYAHSTSVDQAWYPHHGYAPDASENVAGGTSPADVVARWMSDPAHKKTVVFCVHAPQGATYDLGIGAAGGGNGAYLFTMALGERLP